MIHPRRSVPLGWNAWAHGQGFSIHWIWAYSFYTSGVDSQVPIAPPDVTEARGWGTRCRSGGCHSPCLARRWDKAVTHMGTVNRGEGKQSEWSLIEKTYPACVTTISQRYYRNDCMLCCVSNVEHLWTLCKVQQEVVMTEWKQKWTRCTSLENHYYSCSTHDHNPNTVDAQSNAQLRAERHMSSARVFVKVTSTFVMRALCLTRVLSRFTPFDCVFKLMGHIFISIVYNVPLLWEYDWNPK